MSVWPHPSPAHSLFSLTVLSPCYLTPHPSLSSPGPPLLSRCHRRRGR
ncbi:hypothetical protein E2C01_074234 [Portunus trituberculatus]|uniref:Uncharacterized protein n=1 Tax=Portunus trituberculatus TaxID=210409 RepID=A0A5B7IBM0_PORTR|nr:hypothetical protein [Portunus trituberculatus]